jgi:hypothetical protein
MFAYFSGLLSPSVTESSTTRAVSPDPGPDIKLSPRIRRAKKGAIVLRQPVVVGENVLLDTH